MHVVMNLSICCELVLVPPVPAVSLCSWSSNDIIVTTPSNPNPGIVTINSYEKMCSFSKVMASEIF